MGTKVEIIAFEQERIIKRAHPAGLSPIERCAICGIETELLTTAQAAVVTKVASKSIRRWLAQGKAHSVKTGGGQHRVCRESLFSTKKNFF